MENLRDDKIFPFRLLIQDEREYITLIRVDEIFRFRQQFRILQHVVPVAMAHRTGPDFSGRNKNGSFLDEDIFEDIRIGNLDKNECLHIFRI